MQEMQHDGKSEEVGALREEIRIIADDNERLAKALDGIQKDLPLEDIQQFFDASRFMTSICAQLARKNMQLENNKEIIDRLQEDLVKAYTIINSAREFGNHVLELVPDDGNSINEDFRTLVDMLPEKEPVSS